MIDSHCHIHEAMYPLDGAAVLIAAQEAGVSDVICVGTDGDSSRQAIAFAAQHVGAHATVGLHPHESERSAELTTITDLAATDGVVAVGECGLDYYYEHADRESQKHALRTQCELAQSAKLPMIFHIRGKADDSSDAYEDFWQIYDAYRVPGVIHSFSAHTPQLEAALERNLYIGLNGIVTFMRDGPQLDAVRAVPPESMLLETDAPLLTPVPYRGRINEPKYISFVAERIAEVTQQKTTNIREHIRLNAQTLFGIEDKPHVE